MPIITSTEWGNYQLGVAEADSPLSFQNGNKYSYPVVNSNQILLEENYVDLLRYGITYEPLFDYTENNPGVGWMLPVYQVFYLFRNENPHSPFFQSEA